MLKVWGPLSYITDAYDYIFRRETKAGDREMVEHIQRRLYAMVEIRRAFGRLMKKELLELQADGVIDEDTANAIARSLAFKFCAWDLHPPKRPEPKPDPVTVKAAIRSRLSNGSGVRIVQFPDRPKLPAFSLEEMLSMHLKTRS